MKTKNIMNRKIIHIDNAFLKSIWSPIIAESAPHNREVCKNIYINLLHGVVERIRAKADIIMTSGVKRDIALDDIMDLYELSVKADAMMNWFQENDTKWKSEMIDVDGMCRYIDDYCLNADQSYEFIKEAKS
jgi:hypothetical protein